MKKYALLYFSQINDKFSKWIFPLHEGENIIGSDRDVDIFLYLNQKQDKIDSVHCKIIVKENQNDVGIISLASNGFVKRGENEETIILSPGREYELKHKNVFYLTENVKFMLIKGTIEEIHDFFLDENLESEFQKWNTYISAHESKMKINLNLTRKESYNKSFVSNNNENNNNNLTNSIINNNNNPLYNSAISNNNNNNSNNNIPNSILNSNSKDVNRIGFNNFDEFPEDNLISDYKSSLHNPINSSLLNRNHNNYKNTFINISPFKIDNMLNQNEENNNIGANNYIKIKQISTDITNNINNINEKEEINSLKSEIKEESISNSNNNNNKNNSEDNKENNINLNYNKSNNVYNNSLDLFKQASGLSSDHKTDNNYNEKDEKTIQTIKELLGESNLEIIFKNTNYKDVKKYDIIYKTSKNNKSNISGIGNFDIKFKKNDFLNNSIKYEHKYKKRNKKE